MAGQKTQNKNKTNNRNFRFNRDDAFASLLISVIYSRRPSIEGYYRITFNDPRRSEKPFDVHRLVTDDTEHLTRKQVEKELKAVEAEAVNIFQELRVLS